MKTQISGLINGHRDVIRDESHPKYRDTRKATSHDGYVGSADAERYETAQKVFSENPDFLKVLIRGKEYVLKKESSVSGKTSWYFRELSPSEFLDITGYAEIPYTWECSFGLFVQGDMTVEIQSCVRKSERAQWKFRKRWYIGEELVTVL